MEPAIGSQPPELSIAAWVQGNPTGFAQQSGRVVLVEVFQLNCPGCFLYALPQAVALHRAYQARGLTVLGLATAFEDYHLNTLDNLRRLAAGGEVIGETRKALAQRGLLRDGRWPVRLPFPLAMDRLQPETANDVDAQVRQFVAERIADYEVLPGWRQETIRGRLEAYFRAKLYRAETFETFRLRGTPSTILVDRRGLLRDIGFGYDEGLEGRIVQMLDER